MAKKKSARRGGRTPGKWTLLTKEQLRTFREDAKLSRSALSAVLGVSSTSIQNWETERSVPLTRYQEQLVELMKGGVPAIRNGRRSKARVPSGRASNGASPAAGAGARDGTSLTATAEILKGFLATTQGARTSKEELVTLTISLRAALS